MDLMWSPSSENLSFKVWLNEHSKFNIMLLCGSFEEESDHTLGRGSMP